MYGHLMRACVDELIELGGLHPVALKLINYNDIALSVTVPIEAATFGGGDAVRAGAEIIGELAGKGTLSGTTSAVKDETYGLLIVSTRTGGEVLVDSNSGGMFDHFSGVGKSYVTKGPSVPE